MRWHISVFTADTRTLLFAGQAQNRAAAEQAAALARSLRPEAVIFLRSPNGEARMWQ